MLRPASLNNCCTTQCVSKDELHNLRRTKNGLRTPAPSRIDLILGVKHDGSTAIPRLQKRHAADVDAAPLCAYSPRDAQACKRQTHQSQRGRLGKFDCRRTGADQEAFWQDAQKAREILQQAVFFNTSPVGEACSVQLGQEILQQDVDREETDGQILGQAKRRIGPDVSHCQEHVIADEQRIAHFEQRRCAPTN